MNFGNYTIDELESLLKLAIEVMEKLDDSNEDCPYCGGAYEHLKNCAVRKFMYRLKP